MFDTSRIAPTAALAAFPPVHPRQQGPPLRTVEPTAGSTAFRDEPLVGFDERQMVIELLRRSKLAFGEVLALLTAGRERAEALSPAPTAQSAGADSSVDVYA